MAALGQSRRERASISLGQLGPEGSAMIQLFSLNPISAGVRALTPRRAQPRAIIPAQLVRGGQCKTFGHLARISAPGEVSRCMGRSSTLSHAARAECARAKSTTRQVTACHPAISCGDQGGMHRSDCRVSRKASTQSSMSHRGTVARDGSTLMRAQSVASLAPSSLAARWCSRTT
jgi:hypothetical protein